MPSAERLTRLCGLAVGQLTHDITQDGLKPGGCVYYAASTWRAFGARAKLYTSVGEDFAFWSELGAVTMRIQESHRTTCFENLYPPGRDREQWVVSQAAPLDSRLVDDSFLSVDFTYLSPVLDEMDPFSWSGKIRSGLVGLGIQGLIKNAPGCGTKKRRLVCPKPWHPRSDRLEQLDVVFASEEDLRGQSPQLLEILVDAVPLMVLTKGSRGSVLFHRGCQAEVGIFPKSDLKDPTGAGDTFAASMMLGLAGGLSVIESARLASAAGSIIVEGLCGAAFSRLTEAYERMSQISYSCSDRFFDHPLRPKRSA